MPESLRLYALCKAMRWNHLPAPGAIYDQHPKVIDDFQKIMEIENEVERKRQAKEKKKQGNQLGHRRR